MKIHQRLVRLGTRWMPPYPEFAKQNPRVDVSHAVDEIRALPKGNSGLLGLEQLLLEPKLRCILEHVEDGTLIYTEYVDGIVLTLTKALSEAGWKVGRYTGEDKTGLVPFLQGKLNVLIGSSSVGTGVDGLQHRARKLIIACAPWTAAAYEQLVGRLVRQGQQQPVEVIFPLTFADVNGEEWSWCQSRLNRLQYKKSIAGVPLADSEIDVAVFSLSLMGANSGDYLREAARTLVFDGRLIICEASSRLPDDVEIRSRLERLGFHVTDINHDAQFTFIKAIRTDREPETDVSFVWSDPMRLVQAEE